MVLRRTLAIVTLLILPLAASRNSRAEPPALDEFQSIDDFSYSTQTARTHWQPMAGSDPVTVEQAAGRRALKLSCNFSAGRIDRASWDRRVELDLTGRKGVRFLIRCRDGSPIDGLTIYLRSGGGWYKDSFRAPTSEAWVPVQIHKSRMSAEGNPGGWDRIDLIRLSAWRGGAADTEFHIAELGAFGSGGRIVIVRGDSTGEGDSARQYAEGMAALLDGAGVAHTVLAGRNVTAGRLKGMKVVVLPHNPEMSDRTADVLAGFLKAGGKLLACYVLPAKLQPLVGIRGGPHVKQERKGYFASIRPIEGALAGAPPATGQASWNIHQGVAVEGRSRIAAWWYTDAGQTTGKPAVLVSDNCAFVTHVLLSDDRPAKQRLLLAMLGELLPDTWAEAAAGRIRRIGRFEPYDGYAAAERAVRKLAAGDEPASEALGRAAKLRAEAIGLKGRGEFIDAFDADGKADAALLDAHCLAQKPAPGEHRAVWCHSAFGVTGMTWEQAIKDLADNGFTAMLPNMCWGGAAYYQSEVLPVSSKVEDQGDQIALCVAACRKYGVACHVWKVNFNMGWATPKAFAEKMRADGRTQVNPDGSPNARWLCPSHPENRKLEIDAMVEVARKYDVDGLHFDYIRYPGRDGCFCAGCRQRFEKALGRGVPNWPADVQRDGPAKLHQEWMDFRREQITAVVARVADRARKARPGVKISAAVFGNWPATRDSIGQDWKLWCDRGYLDFVCPMDYTPNSRIFGDLVKRQIEWAGKVPCYPGIGLSVWPDPADAAKLIEQIRATRQARCGGFTIFNYTPTTAREVLPVLGKGLTSPIPEKATKGAKTPARPDGRNQMLNDE